MSPPRVTAVIGAYDSARTLGRAIDSLLAQTVADLELIVVDDGSRDASPEIAQGAARRDPRVRPLRMSGNVGIASSLNAAIAQAQGPVVAIQDADDVSAPERLERQLTVLDARPEAAVVGCRMAEVDAEGRRLEPRTRFAAGVVNHELLSFNPIPNSSAAFRRDVVLGLGGYDPRYRYATEYDLWLRVAERWDVIALDEELATREMGGGNVAARAERAQIAEALAIRARALRRRRTLRGASGLVVPAVAWLTPLPLKRTRRRRLGQAP
jgi:glycosyltransferase involved in cell wall biosynthesis